jgi:hypothetical protein
MHYHKLRGWITDFDGFSQESVLALWKDRVEDGIEFYLRRIGDTWAKAPDGAIFKVHHINKALSAPESVIATAAVGKEPTYSIRCEYLRGWSTEGGFWELIARRTKGETKKTDAPKVEDQLCITPSDRVSRVDPPITNPEPAKQQRVLSSKGLLTLRPIQPLGHGGYWEL